MKFKKYLDEQYYFDMLVKMKFYHHLSSSQPRSTPQVEICIAIGYWS